MRIRSTCISLPSLLLALVGLACSETSHDSNSGDEPLAPGDSTSPEMSSTSPGTGTGPTSTGPTTGPGPQPTGPTPTTIPTQQPTTTPTPTQQPTTPPTEPTTTPTEPTSTPTTTPTDPAPTPTTPEGAGGAGPEIPEGAGGAGGEEVPVAPPREEPTLITSGPNAYWQVGEVTEVTSGSANVTINVNQAQQDWHGFGGTFNEAGWDALEVLDASERDRAIQLLFDANDGANFLYGRIPVGSSDYGLNRYSLAPTANDYEMRDFSIERDRQDLIPYIKAALAVKPDIRFWASPWSPPPWMKDNNAFDRGNMKNDAQTLGAHALYLARFVEEYAKEGIHIEHVQPQNEPGYAQDYPSCGWTGSQMADYIANHLSRVFQERGLETEIWLGTMSNAQTDSQIAETVMANANAAQHVKGIGLQWAMGDGNHPTTYAQRYQVPIMQTEHKCGNYPWVSGTNQTRAPNDQAYAEESWGFFKNWIGKGVNSYLAWNMVLDTAGRNLDMVRPWAQNALLAVDRQARRLIVTPTYYVFRHLSQYVDPGSVRVGTQGGDVLAWKNPDGSVVAVLHNSGGQSSRTTLSIDGKLLQFDIPGRGWATVNWQSQ